MKDEVALLATVTLLGVLLQAYFSLQVISARRAFRVSPPLTTGPPEFERVYRAQVNCSEYFPLFLATLWVAGIFFHEGRGVGLGRTRWTPWRPRTTLTRSARTSLRGGGPVRPGLPVRAPPLLPGLRPLRAAQVRAGRAAGRGRGKVAGGRGPGERGPSCGRTTGRSPAPLGIRWASPGGGWRKSPWGRGWGGEEAGPSRATAPLTAARRLAPLYASARALWLLVALAALGLLAHFLPAALRAALLGRLRMLLPWA
ncbi:PREDICTED: leukotriene C4 synthase isoform X1 [Rhinopithecus bieti]|uniref:leukotriene C4 synthase isoform X1 n=1 Tax=Rhinopithecus bieti TaxID=61621 RepID=UPI00083C6AEB|nr:PREDICTED: leukotriene C4 synthase isoform X1 [Rhinopithecus bieti]